MRATLFAPRFAAAIANLEGETAPVSLIDLTAQVARAIYEGEAVDLGLVRGASAFSPAVRRILWMYTSRDVYRMLVHEGGWTPERYEQWLSATLTRP